MFNDDSFFNILCNIYMYFLDDGFTEAKIQMFGQIYIDFIKEYCQINSPPEVEEEEEAMEDINETNFATCKLSNMTSNKTDYLMPIPTNANTSTSTNLTTNTPSTEKKFKFKKPDSEVKSSSQDSNESYNTFQKFNSDNFEAKSKKVLNFHDEENHTNSPSDPFDDDLDFFATEDWDNWEEDTSKKTNSNTTKQVVPPVDIEMSDKNKEIKESEIKTDKAKPIKKKSRKGWSWD